MSNRIGFSDLFAFSEGRDDILDAIRLLKDLKGSYNEFKQTVTGAHTSNMEAQMGALAGEIGKVAKASEQLNITNEKSQEQLAKNLQLIERLKAENDALKKSRDGARSSEEALAGSVEGLTKKLKEQVAEWRRIDQSTEAGHRQAEKLGARIRQTKEEIAGLNSNLKTSTSIIKHAKGSYAELEAQTKALIVQYKRMGDVEGANKQKHEALAKQIHLNTQALKNYDAQINQNFRNVGNYKSAFDGLGMSFAQIGRELPNFAMNIQTGLMAISNNIPMLADELANLKKKNLELAASGQPTKSMLSSIAGALFSWQTLLSVGITLLTVYGKDLIEWIGTLGKGSDALKALKERTRAVNDIVKQGNIEAGKQITTLRALYTTATDANVPMKERLEAVKALKKEFPDYFGKIGDEIILNGKAKKSYEELTKEIIRSSRAKAAKEKVDAIEAQLLDIDFAKQKIVSKTDQEKAQAKDRVFYQSTGGGAAMGTGGTAMKQTKEEEIQIIEARKQRALKEKKVDEDRLKQQRDFLIKFVGGEKAIAEAIVNDTNFGKEKDKSKELEKAIKKKDELIQASAKYQIAQEELKYARSAQTAADEIHLEERRLAILRESYDLRAGLYKKDSKDYKDIMAEKLEAEKNYTLKIRDIKVKEAERVQALQLAQLEAQYANARANYDTDVEFEQKKLEIILKALEVKMGLYQKDSDEYKQFAAQKVQAELAASQKIQAIREAQAQGKQVAETAQAGARDAAFQGSRKLAVAQSANPAAAQASLEKQQHEEKMLLLQIEVTRKQAALLTLKEGDKSYYQSQKELADAQKALTTEKYDWEIKEAERASEKKKALEQAALDFVTTTAGALFDLGREINGANIADLEAAKQKELELAGNNAAAKKKIEENYQKEIIKLKQKQAKYDKLQALFNVAVNTATGIGAALANPYTAPFVIPWIIATGAVQAAVILAKPLPKYEKGRKGGKAEMALVNEKGPELLEKNGTFRFANSGKQGLTYLQQGENVHTAEATRKIFENLMETKDTDAFLDSLLKGTGVVRAYEAAKEEKILQAMVKGGINEKTMGKLFQKAVGDIPLHQTIVTEKGIVSMTNRRNSKLQHQENRNKLGANG